MESDDEDFFQDSDLSMNQMLDEIITQDKKPGKEQDKQKEFMEKQKEKIEEPLEFQELVEHLRGDLSKHIIRTINFDEIF